MSMPTDDRELLTNAQAELDALFEEENMRAEARATEAANNAAYDAQQK